MEDQHWKIVVYNGKGDVLSLNHEKNELKYLFWDRNSLFYLNFRRFPKILKMNISEMKGAMEFKQTPKGVFLHVESQYLKNSISVYDGLNAVCI